MEETSCRARGCSERGFTLIEIVIAVAVVATLVAAGFGIALASRSFAVSAAAAEFDHLLDSARTIARETEGATLAFAPDAYGDGTEVRMLAPGPDGTLTATTLPVFHTRATIEELQTLGKAPFAFVVHASGSLGGRPGFRLGATPIASEIGCPASGSFHFAIHAAGATADRFIPCRIDLATNGPVSLATWPPAVIAPPPTPCSGPCAPAALPTAPSSSPTCPPSYAPVPNGCTPSGGSGSGPNYHVTASLASPTMDVGGTDTITAQATLTNPNTAPAGTPSTIPVLVTPTPPICSVTPATAQASASAFTLVGLISGMCGIKVQADTSTISGASADSASFDLYVSTTATSAPPTISCDLQVNGQCYSRIVDRTSWTFWKYVMPDTQCENVDGSMTCSYLNSTKQIFLTPGYGFQTPLAITPGTELYFVIYTINTVHSQCRPFSYIQLVPGTNPIDWGGSGVGSPVDAPDGFGEPSLFLTDNHLFRDWSSSGAYDLSPSWNGTTTLSQLYANVARQVVGQPYSFTYSGDDPSNGAYVQWHPDFPGCDSERDPGGERQYGIAGVVLSFAIFQRT